MSPRCGVKLVLDRQDDELEGLLERKKEFADARAAVEILRENLER